jgi:hypothetical protein
MNIQKRFKNSLLLLGLLTLSLLPMAETGCKTRLAPGVAQPNVPLYNTDLSIVTTKNVIQNFLQWEQTNRPLIQPKYPEITKYAIQLSNDAPRWLQSAVALRDAYNSNPTAANKSAFDTAMSVLTAAMGEAQKYFAAASKSK